VKTIKMGTYSMGEVPPYVDEILSTTREANSMQIEFLAHFSGDCQFTLIPAISDSITIPVSIKSIKIKGKFRLELVWKPQSTSYSFTTVEYPFLDFSVFTNSFIDLTTIPGFSEWLHHSASETINKYLLWPNKFVFYHHELSDAPPTEVMNDHPLPPPKKSRFQIKKKKTLTKSYEEVLALFGVSDRVKEYVENLCQNEEVFLQFPLEGAESLELSDRQQKHAMIMMSLVASLAKLRYLLCPKKMDDQHFWFVYFSLLKKRTSGLYVDDDNSARVSTDWKELQSFEKLKSIGKNTKL